jgi:predicted DNA-binding protein (MmcQ/YjbR family)
MHDECSKDRAEFVRGRRGRTYPRAVATEPQTLDALEATLRGLALAFPGAWEDHPWGDTVFKAGPKVFVFFGRGDDAVHLGLKLPQSFETALAMPDARPSAYGLGRHGWVSLRLRPGAEPKRDLVEAWLEESYRATAGGRLVRELDDRAGAAAGTGVPATMRTPRKPA